MKNITVPGMIEENLKFGRISRQAKSAQVPGLNGPSHRAIIPLPSRQVPSGREGLGEQPNPPSTPQVVRSVSLILVGTMAPASVEFHPLVSARCSRYGTSRSKAKQHRERPNRMKDLSYAMCRRQ